MQKETILPVSIAAAKLFANQCIGSYSGHMSMIAFNPTLQSIAGAHGVKVHSHPSDTTEKEFATFLRMVADQLSPENAGSMARELAAQDSESPTRDNG